MGVSVIGVGEVGCVIWKIAPRLRKDQQRAVGRHVQIDRLVKTAGESRGGACRGIEDLDEADA